MLRYLILVLCFGLVTATVSAQQMLTVKVFENKTRSALAGINVLNATNKQHAVTSNNGQFNISASLNDILILSGFAYQTDTVLVTNLKMAEIFLEPQGNMLKQVNIGATATNLGTLNDPEFHGQTVVYQRNRDESLKGGVAFRISYWDKDENKRKRDAEKQAEEKTKIEIAGVFTAQNLKKYLPLKAEEMDGFIVRYIPSVKVYTASSFNLQVYLNDSYKEFMKLPPEKRIAEKLTPPL